MPTRETEARERQVDCPPFEPSLIFLSAAISVNVQPPRKKTMVVET